MAALRADRIENKVAQDLATLARTERARMAEERRREHSRARQEREGNRVRNQNYARAGVFAGPVRVVRRGDFWIIPPNHPDTASLRPLTDLLRSRHLYINQMYGGPGVGVPHNWKDSMAGARIMVFYQYQGDKGKGKKGKGKGKDQHKGKGKDQPNRGLKAVRYPPIAEARSMPADATWEQGVILRPTQMAELYNQVQTLWMIANEEHIICLLYTSPSPRD